MDNKQKIREDKQMAESIEQMKKGYSTSLPVSDSPGLNETFQLTFPDKWYDPMDHIDFICGIDPASGKDYSGARIILKTERKVKWHEGDILIGPNGIRFRVSNIGFWTWLHRITCLNKYYNAKLTLIAE